MTADEKLRRIRMKFDKKEMVVRYKQNRITIFITSFEKPEVFSVRVRIFFEVKEIRLNDYLLPEGGFRMFLPMAEHEVKSQLREMFFKYYSLPTDPNPLVKHEYYYQ